MRGDENKNIDVPSKVRAFRKDFPPDKGIIATSFEVKDIGGVPAVVGKAIVGVLTDGDKVPTLLSEAYATRGLRPPVPGAAGMKDTRDAERAMTGAVGRALFLMGYGEKPDDSVDYESEDWFRANGWLDQTEHDGFRTEFKRRVGALGEAALPLWRSIQWPVTAGAVNALEDALVDLEAKAKKDEFDRSIQGNAPVVKVKTDG